MKKSRTGLFMVIFLGGALLSGCSAGTVTVPDTIRIENADAGTDHHITINTSDTVKITPDMAEVTFAISTENINAQQCQQDNTEKLDELLAFLKENDFQEDSIQTSGFSLNPRYTWENNRQTLIGYTMTTEITVSDVTMEQVGGLLSGGVKAGANEIQSVSYYAGNYDEAYAEALTKAVESARKKAETIALADGCQAAELISVEEYSDNQYGRYINSGIRTASGATATVEDALNDMSVMAGQMEVTATIQAVFRLATE